MNPIQNNARNILKYMIENKINPAGGDMINEWFGLSSEEINDAVDFLKQKKAVDVLTCLGTAPYNFLNININSRGRNLYYESLEE